MARSVVIASCTPRHNAGLVARAVARLLQLLLLPLLLLPLLPLQGEHKPKRLQRELLAALAPWTSRRASLFSKAVGVDTSEAARQLASGEAALSKFGHHDAVQWLEHGTLSAPLVPAPPPPKVKAEGEEEEEAEPPAEEEGEEGDAPKKPGNANSICRPRVASMNSRRSTCSKKPTKLLGKPVVRMMKTSKPMPGCSKPCCRISVSMARSCRSGLALW